MVGTWISDVCYAAIVWTFKSVSESVGVLETPTYYPSGHFALQNGFLQSPRSFTPSLFGQHQYRNVFFSYNSPNGLGIATAKLVPASIKVARIEVIFMLTSFFLKYSLVVCENCLIEIEILGAKEGYSGGIYTPQDQCLKLPVCLTPCSRGKSASVVVSNQLPTHIESLFSALNKHEVEFKLKQASQACLFFQAGIARQSTGYFQATTHSSTQLPRNLYARTYQPFHWRSADDPTRYSIPSGVTQLVSRGSFILSSGS